MRPWLMIWYGYVVSVSLTAIVTTRLPQSNANVHGKPHQKCGCGCSYLKLRSRKYSIDMKHVCIGVPELSTVASVSIHIDGGSTPTSTVVTLVTAHAARQPTSLTFNPKPMGASRAPTEMAMAIRINGSIVRLKSDRTCGILMHNSNG